MKGLLTSSLGRVDDEGTPNILICAPTVLLPGILGPDQIDGYGTSLS